MASAGTELPRASRLRPLPPSVSCRGRGTKGCGTCQGSTPSLRSTAAGSCHQRAPAAAKNQSKTYTPNGPCRAHGPAPPLPHLFTAFIYKTHPPLWQTVPWPVQHCAAGSQAAPWPPPASEPLAAGPRRRQDRPAHPGCPGWAAPGDARRWCRWPARSPKWQRHQRQSIPPRLQGQRGRWCGCRRRCSPPRSCRTQSCSLGKSGRGWREGGRPVAPACCGSVPRSGLWEPHPRPPRPPAQRVASAGRRSEVGWVMIAGAARGASRAGMPGGNLGVACVAFNQRCIPCDPDSPAAAGCACSPALQPAQLPAVPGKQRGWHPAETGCPNTEQQAVWARQLYVRPPPSSKAGPAAFALARAHAQRQLLPAQGHASYRHTQNVSTRLRVMQRRWGAGYSRRSARPDS